MRLSFRTASLVLAFAGGGRAGSAGEITWPEVSIKACPAEMLEVKASDGHAAKIVVRKPPGAGPFPAVVILHGGLNERNPERALREVLRMVTNSRFLAAGYVTVEAIYRSQNEDPQAKDAFSDCLAVVQHVKRMSEVDPKSVVVFGHSGGGSMALELASQTDLAAIVAGEPATILFTGMLNRDTRRRDQREAMMADPKKYCTPALQAFTRAKIQRIQCPILIVHGDQHAINKVNREIVIPELEAAGKKLEVILYPGQPHLFVFGQDGSPAAALKCFQDSDAFIQRFIAVKPRPIASTLLTPRPAALNLETKERGRAGRKEAKQ